MPRPAAGKGEHVDAKRFDRWTRTQAAGGSRRRAILGLGAAVVVAALGRRSAGAAMLCRPNQQPCKRGSQCCSGVCAGKNGKRRCRAAFSQSTCTIEKNACPQGETTGVTDCGTDCWCWVAAEGASLCGALIDNARTCRDCARIAPGTICVRGGAGECPKPFACVRPCFG
jgi:hypothetical protein